MTNAVGTAYSQVPGANTPELQEDAQVLPTVPEYLARGLDLRRWWADMESQGGPREQDRFPIERTINRPNRSFGFYGEAPVGGNIIPVMGDVQEMFYDQPRAPASLGPDSAEWMWAQLREFVMKYFMRVSSFREPEPFVDAATPVPPPAFAGLSWCPQADDSGTRRGFGFTQLFHKPVGLNKVEAFPTYDRFAIVDQREIGNKFEWVLLKVRIFDFNVSVRLFGRRGPELLFGANEQSYVVTHQEFITHKSHHIPGVLGDYGIGYAFVRNPVQGPFGYGPGEFDAAIQLINFRIYETGYITVRMVFVANRPRQISNLTVDPAEWSFKLADVFSLGLASRIFSPARELFNALPLRFDIDPVSAYISGANLVSDGAAAQTLCISVEQLEKLFLLQHFKQHYETIIGSLLTWRQIPDWLDEKKLPPWVISGMST